jgi:GntR family transcriptional repressor for pyruvate dehydrogenase complex
MFEAASKTEKVSDRIIDQIRDAVLSGQVKPGDRLASEKELITQFEVSKATMREALRVLEAMGLVEMRKGTAGGVFVSEVDMKTAVHSMMNFLHFKSVSVRHITMLRFMLEPSVAHMAANYITEEDVHRLEEMIEVDERGGRSEVRKEIGFHRYLVRLTQNPILILMMDFVENILRDLKYELDLGSDFYKKVSQSHHRILDCLVRKDCAGARREIAADLLEVGDHLADLTGSPRFDPAELGLNRFALYQHGLLDSPNGMEPAAKETLAALMSVGLDPKLSKNGLVFRQVGSGDIYLVLPHGEK